MDTNDSTIPLKKCTKCGNEYPSTKEFFRIRNGRITLPCNNCTRQTRQLWRRKNGIPAASRANRTETHGECTRCKQWKPLSEKFFRRKNGKYTSQCIECEIAYKEQRRRSRGAEPAKIGVIVDGYMQCVDCGLVKPATKEHFSLNRSAKSGLSGQCRECRRIYLRVFRRKPEQVEAEKAYRQRPEVKLRKKTDRKSERAKATWKTYRQTSPKYKAYRQSSEYNDLQRAYARSERGKAKARTNAANRRARELGLPNTLTIDDWNRAVDYFGGCCAVCGRPSGLWHKLAQDHWIPLSSPDCPGTIPLNIIPLCQGLDGCNNSKNSRNAEVWLIERFGARKAKQVLKHIQDYFDWLRSNF